MNRRVLVGDVDMVVLDQGLPGMDGVEVVGRLRGWTEVPVLVLSTHEAPNDRVRGLDAGADDYASKPFAGQLRRKLLDTTAAPRWIGTEPGLGSRWKAEPSELAEVDLRTG